MKRQLAMLIVLVAALFASATPSAQACNGYGYDSGYGWMYQSLQYNVPYFAAHPPVYYSYPVPRTYGYSPFAYPPGVMTPDVVGEAQPLEIINPHVPSNESTPARDVSDRSVDAGKQPETLVINNPFVSPNRAVAQSGQ